MAKKETNFGELIFTWQIKNDYMHKILDIKISLDNLKTYSKKQKNSVEWNLISIQRTAIKI